MGYHNTTKKRGDSNLRYIGNIPLRPSIELFNGLVNAHANFHKLLEPSSDDLPDLGVYPRFIPLALAQAGFHDFMQHVSPHKGGGGLAWRQTRLDKRLRCIEESGGGDEEVGVEDS